MLARIVATATVQALSCMTLWASMIQLHVRRAGLWYPVYSCGIACCVAPWKERASPGALWCCRCVAQMEKLLSVMRALDVPQGIAETLLEVHKGNAAAAIGAAVDGTHG